MANNNLPTISPEGSLTSYLHAIRKFPMLKPDEEFMLAKAWTEHGDTDSAISSLPPICDWWQKLPWDTADTACLLVILFPKAMSA